ncbi:YopX family protein [Lysinibacillus sp. NPDC058147]|uniref:YopX family protein n=1 Tax=unclassified Lysinibacillus TaxID=2636778 RepID=UPI0036D87629
MSREIKFRAWDKTYNFMSYKVLVGNVDTKDENYTAHCMWVEPESVDYKREPGWMHFDELSDVVLMQYTGLKDKNSKEIFEGDLFKHPTGIIAEIEYAVEFAAYLAKYKLGESYRRDLLDPLIASQCDVVGNKYEHPELLGETA